MVDVEHEEIWLERRAGDLWFPPEELVGLPPFNAVRSPTLKGQLEDKPNSVVVRRYREGDVICWQGAAGGTAYYILTREELAQCRDVLAKPSGATGDPDHENEIGPALEDMNQVIEGWDRPSGVTELAVARVHLAVPAPRSAEKESWFGKIRRRIWGGRAVIDQPGQESKPTYIPIDGPRDLDYVTRTDELREGELFGEMSCMNRMPRSASVVALRDCFVVEVLRVIFDVMLKDPNYKKSRDDIYRRRYLKLHLRNTPLMRLLTDSQVDRIKNDPRLELVEYPPGTLIVDQNDRADGLYLVRSGVVKVIQNASFLVSPAEIVEPVSLARELALTGRGPSDPLGEVASCLTPSHQEILRNLSLKTAVSPADLGRLVRASLDQPSDPLRALWSFLPVADATRYREHEAGSLNEADASELLTRALKPFLAAALNEIIKGDRLRCLPSVRMRVKEKKVGLRVWRLFTEASHQSPAAMRKAMRGLLSKIFGKLPKLLEDPDVSVDARFRVDEFLKLPVAKAGAPAKGPLASAAPGPTSVQVSELLAPAARSALGRLGQAALDPGEIEELVGGLNDLLEDAFLLGSTILLKNNRAFLDTLEEFLPKKRAWTAYDTDQAGRADHRLLLEPLLEKWLSPKQADLTRTVNYLSDRDFLGEIAVLHGVPRTATCVTYSHPSGDPRRVGPVRLVFIPEGVIEELLAEETSAAFRSHLEQTAQFRTQQPSTLRRPAAHAPRIPLAPLDSPEAEALGLVEGRALMLIDLDRCTRCDQCVEACIAAHGDGRSRLYLDGPQFARFLVPATCRSCLDPVCASRCPVSAIWKGNHQEIVITDWCIGCGACSDDCPYGAIQMHGIAWRFLPAAKVGDRPWYLTNESDQYWLPGENPFKLDRDLRIALEKHGYRAGGEPGSLEPVCFRYRFPEHRYALDLKSQYRLEVSTLNPQITLWLNDQLIFDEKKETVAVADLAGISVEVTEPAPPKKIQWKIQFTIPGRRLRSVGNLLAAKVRPAGEGGQSFFEVKWEVAEEDKPDAHFETKKIYQQAALVCDQCSTLPGGPACVSQCPHDAAIRIDVPNEIVPGRASL